MFRESQQIGVYTLIKKLGQGGFGEVWLAENRSHSPSEKVAIKLPRNDQIDLQAVKEEVFNWTGAGKHKNILPFIEWSPFGNRIALVSEYAPDGSLQDLINKKGSLPEREAVEIAVGILDGLAHLHNRKIIHRDLKPDNVLFQGNVPRLTDFGISRALSVDSQSKTISGTRRYMAPEAFDGKRNVQTDIWSVGVILYQLLSGSLPFPQRDETALMFAIVSKDFVPLPESIPLALQNIVKKALEKETSNRYETADAIAKDLRRFWQENFEQNLDVSVITKLPINSSIHSETLPIDSNSIVTQIKLLVPFRRGDKWGFSDINKEIIIDVKYDEVEPFSNELAVVKLGGKYAVIDKTGREITPLKYDGIGSFSEGLAPIILNGKWGFIDKTGREVIPPKYDDSYSFSEGLAKVGLNNKKGFIDKAGRQVIPFIYENTYGFFEEVALVMQNGKWGIINKTGNQIASFKYDKARSFSEGIAAVSLNYKWGFIDKTGNEITLFKYRYSSVFGGILISFREGLAKVELNKKQGFIDKSGREVISLKYTYVKDFSEGLSYVKLNHKGGFINYTGDEIIPFKYDHASDFSEGLAAVELNNKMGYINKNGNEIISFKYDFSYHPSQKFKSGLAGVKLNGKWGFIDKIGKEITSFKYDFIDPFSNGIAKVAFNGNTFYIDQNGTEYYEP